MGKHYMFIKTFAVLAALVLTGILAGEDFTIVKENQAKSTIVLPDNAPKTVIASIGNFNRTLKTITGTSLPVVRKETAGNRIVFKLRKTDSLKTADNFTITFPDSRTMCIEGTEFSVQWALNHIIRKFAKAEWVLPESCGLSYTPMKDLAVPVEKIEVKGISWPVSRINSVRTIWHLYDLRLGLGCNHDLTRHAFPKEKYGKDKWPQVIMPVLKGKKISAPQNPKDPRAHWQPCYSNPETAKIAVENLLEYLEKHPGTAGLSLGVNDNGGFCECAECLKLDKNSRYSRSESYFTFVNRVMDEVSKKYPNLIAATLAYHRTYQPPSFKLHPNVVVFLTIDFESCVSPKVKEKHKKIIAEWSRKSTMFGVWDYSWGYPYPVPRMYLPVHLEMLKYFSEHNAKAYCGQSWTVDAREGPKQYLIAKLLWNSKQDMQKLEEEWYVRCVGKKAAPYLKAYYQVWNDYFTGNRIRQTPWFKSTTSVYMTYNDISCIYALREEDIQAADKAMKQVVELAETQQEKQRAEVLMRHWRQTFLRLRLLGAGVYDPQGFIHTPQQALKLLDYVAKSWEYQQEYDRISETLCRERDLRPFYLSKAFIREGATPVGQKYDNYVRSHILAASAFSSHPEVKKELDRIASNPAQPDMIRQFCKVTATLDEQQNLLPDGNAENGVKPGYEIHPALRRGGDLFISGKYKSEGGKSFMVSINGHDTLFWILAKAKPDTAYLATFKAFIPTPSAEGYLNAALYAEKSGTNQQWLNLSPLKLSGGVWQTFSVLTTTAHNSNSVRLRIYMKNFEVGDEIYIDDIRLIEVGTGIKKTSGNVRHEGEKNMNLKKNKIASTVLAAVVSAAAFAVEELPKELEGTPKEEIRDVSRYIFGPRADDPEAPANGKTVVLKPAPNTKKHEGVLMGVYDKVYHKATKKVIGWCRVRIPDEKYHWYKIPRTSKDGEFSGEDRVTVYLENWKIGARLPKSFKGKYDCWLLVKAQGPLYVDGSAKENMIFLSRVLLVPVK